MPSSSSATMRGQRSLGRLATTCLLVVAALTATAPTASAATDEPEVIPTAAVSVEPLPDTVEPPAPEPDPLDPEPPTAEPEPPAPEPQPTVEATADVAPTPPATTSEPSPTITETTSEEPTNEPEPQSSPQQVSAPAWQDSPVEPESVLIAGSVLLAAVVLLIAASLLRGGRRPSPAPPPPAPYSPAPGDTTAFLVALGEAMIDAGDPVPDVTATLERIAARNGIPDAEVVVFATALIVSVPGREHVSTAVSAAGVRGLRMDQIDEVFDVAEDAETFGVEPGQGVRRLQSIRNSPAPWGVAVRVLGYAIMSVGLSLVLGASVAEIAVTAVLGAIIGALQLSGAGLTSTYRSVLPLVSAFAVATVVFLLARTSLDIGTFAPLIAPLVGLLPGALLTTGVLELATGQMISGAGRIAAGAMRLFLLALGIVAAAQLVGVPTSSVTDVAAQPLDTWAPWIGVAIFGVGIVAHLCARPRSTPWILLVLYVAYAGQVIGGLFLGGVLSAFVGAVLMTPVAILVARHPSGPTPLVSFLPAFWLLVPGALGLVGVAKYIGDARLYGADSLLTTAETMVAIALGVLFGTSLASRLTTSRKRA